MVWSYGMLIQVGDRDGRARGDLRIHGPGIAEGKPSKKEDIKRARAAQMTGLKRQTWKSIGTLSAIAGSRIGGVF